jgi:hypothetical protein
VSWAVQVSRQTLAKEAVVVLPSAERHHSRRYVGGTSDRGPVIARARLAELVHRRQYLPLPPR